MANQVLFELVVEGGVTARASPSFPLPTVTLIGNPQVVPGPDRTIEDGLRFGVKDMISVGTTPGSPRLRLPHEYTIDLWFRTCIFLAASVGARTSIHAAVPRCAQVYPWPLSTTVL